MRHRVGGNNSSKLIVPVDLTVAVLVHNGESVLEQTLKHLTKQSHLDGVAILAICNGCNDRSADVARKAANLFEEISVSYGVLDLPKVGRNGALNVARRLCKGALLVIDQDVILSCRALSAISDAFLNGYCFATLRPSVVRSRSFLVNAYYRFWLSLRYVRHSPATMGFYAISRQGLQRLPRFPAIHSDDKFARLHFKPHERIRIESEWYQVTPQQNLVSLLRDRMRYNRANRELAQLMASQVWNDAPRVFINELDVVWNNLGDATAFAMVTALSRIDEWFDFVKTGCGRVVSRQDG